VDADVQERPHLGWLTVLNPLRRFLVAALLWLPFAFFVWFFFAGPMVWPVIALVRFVLLTAWPQLFTAVTQGADLLDAQGRVLEHLPYLMQLSTSVMVDVAEPGAAPRFGLIEPTVNPMVYGYALPLFAGLVLATPVSARRRMAQLAVGIPLIWIAQAFGVVSESLKIVVIDAGPLGAEAASRAGLPINLVALCYQFGYLVLPSLVPAVLWIACNRTFIELLIRRDTVEPVAARRVEAPPDGDG
jgi:hypothetical protein